MTSMGISASTPFTVHDLEGMPDDGRRYELIDGELLVSPAPGLRHQTISYQLHRLLDDACPGDMYVIAAPFAVQTDISNEVQPDVLVARFDDLTEKNLPTAPMLAVEVLSPNGRLIDLNLKRRLRADGHALLLGAGPLRARSLGAGAGHRRPVRGGSTGCR
jgi:Uma2 family endonuclease